MQQQEEENKFDILNPGILLEEDDPKYQDLVQQLEVLKQKMVQYKNIKQDFIGAHPVSLTEKLLQEVWTNQENYLICEKTDGVRYILLMMSSGEVYLTGRKTGAGGVKRLQFFQINLNLPHSLLVEQNHQLMYVFDGELSIECYTHIESARNQNIQNIKYLVFDTMLANFVDVHQDNYDIRLKYAENFQKWMKTCFDLQKSGLTMQKSEQFSIFRALVKTQQKIQIVVKDFFYFKMTEYLLNYYIKNIPHNNDGLIFTRVFDSPYKPGTCDYIIKWKPPQMNSIDFLVVPNENLFDLDIVDLYVYSGQDPVFFDFMGVSQKFLQSLNENLQKLQEEEENSDIRGVVCECVFSKKNKKNWQNLSDIYQLQFEEILDQSVIFGQMLQAESQDQDGMEDEQNGKLALKRENHSQTMSNIYNANLKLRNKFQQCGWKFDKFRVDKSTPNNYRVALNILQTLEEGITAEKLITKSKDISYLHQYQQNNQHLNQQYNQNNNEMQNKRSYQNNFNDQDSPKLSKKNKQ